MTRTRPGVATLLWLGSFLGAFTLTHLPPPPEPRPHLIGDKAAHFAGFAGLGAISGWRFAGRGRSRRGRLYLLLFAGLALYGAVDEWTQPLVGRTCELGDWLADIGGAVPGLVAVALWSAPPGRGGTH